jgi:type I restriction enzyme R subunit
MLAERYFAEDPNTCLLKLRQLADVMAQIVASHVGLLDKPDDGQYETLDEAYEAAAKGLVKKSSEADRQVEYYSLKELLEAKQHEAAQAAAAKPHFGMRFTRLVPPGTG